MADLRTLYYDNAPTILTRATDRKITLTDLDPNRRNTRIVILQIVERMKADIAEQETSISVDPTWIRETPSGTMNGSNTGFVLSQDPDLGSLILSHNNAFVVRVGSSPAAGEYSISGTNITMGLAPNSGDSLVAQYQRD